MDTEIAIALMAAAAPSVQERPSPRATLPEMFFPRGRHFSFHPINSDAIQTLLGRYPAAALPDRCSSERESMGSMFSLAAVSSMPHGDTAACGWFGARHARAGPILLRIDDVLLALVGNGEDVRQWREPPPPGPPVPQDCDCHAVMVPSFFAPNFTRA